ncbi:MAG: ATP-binding protein [Bacteroidetes bacterium]|nr:ATP-binding protein [Bacteroidota bacterium]
MKKPDNPFLISGYHSPPYFCNRNDEVKHLEESLLNGRNITLFSPRRLGKTGLIHHFFYRIREKKINSVYVDIFGTENLSQFIRQFANAAIRSIAVNKEKFIEKAMKFFGSIRPQFSFNERSGMPEMTFALQSDREKGKTLDDIFDFLESQRQPNVIAFDEFQQINEYPEKNTEKLLRSSIQQLKNSQFLFSGSQRHLLLSMFSDAKRAFYQSTGFLSLKKLNRTEYFNFISIHFKKDRQIIEPEAVDFILDWTKGYTFYTQDICNKIFLSHYKKITIAEVKKAIQEIFYEREVIYYNYRKILPEQQYRLLKAIAAEDIVTEPTGQNFINKHGLGNPSTVRKSLKALMEKELIYDSSLNENASYEVYDVFLEKWLVFMEQNNGR